MTLWNVLTDTAAFAAGTVRGALRWGERVVPWPLSLVPRTLRLPLDVAALFVESGTEPPRGSAPDARAREQPRAHQRRARAAAAPDEHKTTIAGSRSDGPNDSPRWDREVRARLAPLYTRDAGTGPAIVLLHAFPLNGRMWELQLGGLADRFRVLAPDLAGFGLSWTPESSFSLDDQAAAVELSLEDLEVHEMVLVGLSMGGYVAFPLLERLGRRVRGLVLASTRATADDDATATDRHRLAAEVEANGVAAAADELLPKLIGTSTLRDRPELIDRVRAVILENKESGVAAALRAMAARPDRTGMLHRIGCPVLVVAGEDDPVITVEDGRRMASRIRDARFTVVPRAGHLTNLEAPAEFNRAVAEFAGSVFAGTRAAARAHGTGQRSG
jgi:pimeloyl-ACP methyl ester carboxylesterase